MNKWCEHSWGIVADHQKEWKFCPICGTPRPEKKKELWEVLLERQKGHWKLGAHCDSNSKCLMDNLADAAKRWFLEQIDQNEIAVIIGKNEKYLNNEAAKEIIDHIKEKIN